MKGPAFLILIKTMEKRGHSGCPVLLVFIIINIMMIIIIIFSYLFFPGGPMCGVRPLPWGPRWGPLAQENVTLDGAPPWTLKRPGPAARRGEQFV